MNIPVNLQTESKIVRIYISRGHNFFGHYGGEPGANELVEVPEAECVAGRGLVGDRFFDYKPDYKGQITFFALETLEQMWKELGVAQALRDPSAPRRNILTSGIDLLKLAGLEFEMQGVRFSGVEECRPCEWMNQAIHPDAEQWLRGRGGLRARILSSGTLRAGASMDSK
jgi:MOSC domain-containing protein YiiM